MRKPRGHVTSDERKRQTPSFPGSIRIRTTADLYFKSTEGFYVGLTCGGGANAHKYERRLQLGAAWLLPSGALSASVSTRAWLVLTSYQTRLNKRDGKTPGPSGMRGERSLGRRAALSLCGDGNRHAAHPRPAGRRPYALSPPALRSQRKQRFMCSAPESSFSINPLTCIIRCRSQRMACQRLLHL